MNSDNYNKLNSRQKSFVIEYLKDKVASAAAKRAGYRCSGAKGHDLLRHPAVKKAIEEMLEEQKKATLVTAEFVINGLKEVVERCMQHQPVMIFDKSKRELVQETDDSGQGVWRFDSIGANKAYELLGKHLAIFGEKPTDPTSVVVEITDYSGRKRKK